MQWHEAEFLACSSFIVISSNFTSHISCLIVTRLRTIIWIQVPNAILKEAPFLLLPGMMNSNVNGNKNKDTIRELLVICLTSHKVISGSASFVYQGSSQGPEDLGNTLVSCSMPLSLLACPDALQTPQRRYSSRVWSSMGEKQYL